jgi:penicillin-binding protein 2
MLEGSLKDQYRKLYPQKHQDSIALLNSKVSDSIVDNLKKRKDSINGTKPKNEVKKDSTKNKKSKP